MKTFFNFFLALFFALGIVACNNTVKTQGSLPKIVCTTGMLGDAAKNLLGDSAEVSVLMGPGVDPHLYKATQGDVQLLSSADVILYNGLHLEGKMQEIFSRLQKTKTIIAAGELLNDEKLINSTDYAGAHDPHIWFDVALWSEAIAAVSAELQKKYPGLQSYIKANEKVYLNKLIELNSYCTTSINQIPEKQRVLITAHDAFKYFGKAYGIEVMGLQGISTTAEYGLQDISRMVQFITENGIKAIFVESSVPKRSIEAIIEGCSQKGHQVQLGGELFSDAMGEAGTPEGTYIGMVKHNVNTINQALK